MTRTRQPRASARPAHMSLNGVTKRYGGVTALDDVDFSCALGSIHAVLGENGAGKSTLIKIMAGVVSPDEGRMTLAGTPVAFPGRRRRTTPASSASSRNCRCCRT